MRQDLLCSASLAVCAPRSQPATWGQTRASEEGGDCTDSAGLMKEARLSFAREARHCPVAASESLE